MLVEVKGSEMCASKSSRALLVVLFLNKIRSNQPEIDIYLALFGQWI